MTVRTMPRPLSSWFIPRNLAQHETLKMGRVIELEVGGACPKNEAGVRLMAMYVKQGRA